MRACFLLFFIFISSVRIYSQEFEKYFTGNVLRFDFMFSGDKTKTILYPVAMKEEQQWPGPGAVTSRPVALGNFVFELFDKQDGRIIYTNGFNTLFQEWQTTSEAETSERSFYEVIRMPFPKNNCELSIRKREKNGTFTTLYRKEISPTDYFILREKPRQVGSTRIYGSSDPSVSVDLAFIAEGYTENEMSKFREDVKTMADALLSEVPFKEYRDKFNIWAVEAISQESGTDIPGEHIYKNTAINSNFYTFDLDRYLTTTDIKAIRDYAAAVPYDNIVVLINSERYGGGGIYNYYSGTTTRHPTSKIVFLHEFGHGFAGLADEYYNSTVAYNDFYPLDVEPWEPNITTLVDFRLKWTPAIKDGIPVPTPEEEKYRNVVGLFEGGGYREKGIFRPEMDCRMKSNGPKGFCSVCSNAIRKVIEYYINEDGIKSSDQKNP